MYGILMTLLKPLVTPQSQAFGVVFPVPYLHILRPGTSDMANNVHSLTAPEDREMKKDR